MPSLLAAIPVDRDQQDRRSPTERFVRQPTRRGIPQAPLLAAAPARRVTVDDAAGQHRTIRFQELPGDAQTEPVEPRERSQIWGREGSVSHVEVFQMDGVGTTIFGRPRPLSQQRRADPVYTLKCEEPEMVTCNELAVGADPCTLS